MTALIEQYQDETVRLADGTATTVAALWAALQDSMITEDEFVDLIASVVGAAVAASAVLADAFVVAQVEAATGAPAAAAGVTPRDEHDRLAVAARTILADNELDPEPRFERLARAEPLGAAQRHAVEAMAGQPAVAGWRVALSADACDLCQWYAANGRVYRVTRQFKQPHPGCNCQPEVVTRKETR